MNNDIIIKVGKRVLILGGLLSIIFLIAFKEPKPIILGLVFGTLVSLLSFKLMDNTIKRAMQMSPTRASGYTVGHYYGRLAIYTMVLIVGAKADYLNFLAVAGGLVSVKVIIVLSNIFDKNFHK